MTGHAADPIVTADLSADCALDLVIGRVVARFWRSLEQEDRGAAMWWLRYDESGECLKLRLHADNDREESLRGALHEAAAYFLDRPVSLPPAEPAETTVSSLSRAPPIDVEDGSEDDCRPLLSFTTYRRHPVSLGPSPFLEDDACVEALTHALSLASDTIVDAAAEDEGEGLTTRRQAVLIGLLAEALPGLGPRAEDYVHYHRDWLIRAPLLKRNGGSAHGEEMLRRLERFAADRSAQIDLLRSTLDLTPAEPTPAAKAVTRLVNEAERCAKAACVIVDPFSAERSFPVVFKLFHGWANALGLSRVDEAFTHHLLARTFRSQPRSNEDFSIFPFAGEFS
ncbi:MAG: hypothetical protein MPN21_13075 [Thermoanaerobaculia bacterium]|nr:hypothetical protein [Thermoanaerobaculia bacterium]